MSIFDQQMRSLTVAPVLLDRKIKSSDILPQAKSGLKSLFTTKKGSASSFSTPKDEYLLILTCDRLAILKGDPANEGSVHGGGLSTSTSSASLEPSNPPFVSIPLSLLKDAYAEGSILVVDHYLPALGHKKPASPTTATSILSSSISSAGGSSSSSSTLFNDDGSYSFPFITASVAAISKLRKGDAPGTHLHQLRLHTDSADAANELAKAVHRALQRLLNALLWLDRGLPLEIDTSLAVSTVSLTATSTLSTTPSTNINKNNKTEILLTRAPSWGSTVKLPLNLTTSQGVVSINIDICTPLGPCHAIIPVQKLLSLGAGEELTVTAVCSNNAQSVAGSLNLSASMTIGDIVVKTVTTTTNASMPTSITGKQVEDTKNEFAEFFAGCIGAALALLVATVFSGLQVDVPLACVGAFLFVVMLVLQKKKNTTTTNQTTTNQTTTNQTTTNKEIQVVDSFSLLHAEITEGPDDELDDLPSVTNQSQPLARQLTASLARRDSYLQRSTTSTAAAAAAAASSASPTSFARLKSITSSSSTQKQQPGAAGALVDLGAVSLRRVVSRSITALGSTVVREHHLDGTYTTTAKRLPPTATLEARHESDVLAKLHAMSPAITPALFERYTAACGGDKKKALTRLKTTAEWRANNDIDTILISPVPRFKFIKAAYLHAVIGWTKDGSMPVVVEGMGAFKKALIQLAKDNITPAEMIQQFVFVLEWVLNDLTKDKSGSFVRIYDLKGISLFDLADKQAIALGQQMMDLLEKYYPERMAMAFVVNTPSFFATAWKMVKPMLDPRTAQKIQVLSGTAHTYKALSVIMEDDVIPVAYGGKNPIDGYDIGFEGGWYEGQIEKRLSAFADELNNKK